jgi:hypothetical protein
MMNKSTPRPWTYMVSRHDGSKQRVPLAYTIYAAEETGTCRSVTSIDFSGGVDEEDASNAALIVRAVNQSDHVAELVVAVQEYMCAGPDDYMTRRVRVSKALAHFEDKS